MRALVWLQYFGKEFSGFQKQSSRRTVAGEVEKALKELFGTETKIYGCARTDSGAHAVCHPVAFDVPESFDAGRLKGALNAHLPQDIQVVGVREASKGFFPLKEAVARTYVYLIARDENNRIFLNDYSWHPGINLTDEAILALDELIKLFEGRHNFKGFSKSGSSAKTTVRTIFDAAVKKNKALTAIVFTGSGFLYGQVRNMVGALLDVLKEKLEPDAIKRSLESGERLKISKPAPPQGLFLYKVWFRNRGLNFEPKFPFLELELNIEDKIYSNEK